ncbi:MAG: hypothetical protein ACFFFK_08515 [Candidatus Thorarchaeota archaeon]
MKTKWMYLFAGFAILVLCISVYPVNVSADMVWQDNFNDGNYDGWTTFAFLDWNTGPTVAGNFSVEGGALTVLDNDVNYARHDSTVEVGTWSFDLFVPDTPNGYVGVSFMSNGTRPIVFDSRWIAVEATTVGIDRFNIWWQRGADEWIGDTCYTPTGSILGWHHIDITRTSGGVINIFFNGTFEYNTITNDVIHSTYLECYGVNATGAAFDNFMVNNTIDISTVSTTPTTSAPPEIPYLLIGVGVGVAVLVIIAIVCLRRR